MTPHESFLLKELLLNNYYLVNNRLMFWLEDCSGNRSKYSCYIFDKKPSSDFLNLFIYEKYDPFLGRTYYKLYVPEFELL